MTLAVNTAQLVSGNGLYTDASGNVGIGTSSPAEKLDVGGNSILRGTTFIAGGSGNARRLGFDASGVYYNWIESDGTAGNGYMRFATVNVERARIDASGNLLVGTTTTSKTTQGIQITGSFFADFVRTAGNDVQNFYNAGTGTRVGQIVVNASTTTYSTSSDYRLKENVQPMTGALAKVAALKPCSYTWKADGSAAEGFIAHELAEVCPNAVVGEKDAVNEDGSIKPQGIDTSFLVATLTAAIQELKAEVDALRAQVEAK